MARIHERAPSVSFREVADLFIASFARPSFAEEGGREAVDRPETPQNPLKPRKPPQRQLRDILLMQLSEQPGLSMAALAQRNNASLDSIRHHMQALQSSGRIRHVGPSRGGYWEVLDWTKGEEGGV